MGKTKIIAGTVVSDKMQKTRVVKIMRMSKHPKYSKIVKKHTKCKAHDEKNISKTGDTVEIRETRPLSKDKRFMIMRVLKKAAIHELEIKEEGK